MGTGFVRRFVGLRSMVSAGVLTAAGVTGWAVWPTAPPIPQLKASIEDAFEGKVVLVPADAPGSNMHLGEDFAYVGPDGKRWVASAGLETDGASIPSLLYPVVGHPFDGSYLKAAVVHDAACPSETENWRDAHLMFYYALRRCGVEEMKAKVMYAAVYHFGPRWRDPTTTAADGPSPYEENIVRRKLAEAATSSATAAEGDVPPSVDVRYDEEKRALTISGLDPAMEEAVRKQLFEKCRAWIERENPTLAKIEDWTAGMGEPTP